MGALEAITLVNSLMGLVVNAMIEAQRVSAVLMQMQTEGRTEFTEEEKTALLKARDDAMKALEDALKP